MKVGGVGTELADWVGITVRRDADHMHVGMNVDSGRVRIDDISAAAEAGTGTGNDRSLDLPGLGRLLRLLVWDDHGCLQLDDTDRVRTRCRVPRGVSRTFEVSPTGSVPRREDPTWQVTKEKVEASRAKLRCGQGAPKAIRPQTRVTRLQNEAKRHTEPDLPNQSSRDARVPPTAAR